VSDAVSGAAKGVGEAVVAPSREEGGVADAAGAGGLEGNAQMPDRDRRQRPQVRGDEEGEPREDEHVSIRDPQYDCRAALGVTPRRRTELGVGLARTCRGPWLLLVPWNALQERRDLALKAGAALLKNAPA